MVRNPFIQDCNALCSQYENGAHSWAATGRLPIGLCYGKTTGVGLPVNLLIAEIGVFAAVAYR